jgi:large subunit ribosomal protein L22
MDFIATQKYLIESPRKIREVVALVKKLSPSESILKLEFVSKKAAEPLIKVIKTAMGQAKKAGISEDALKFKEIQVGEGPRLKRGRAASRGRWHPYAKRMAHIRVILTVEKEKEEVKKVKKEVKKEEKKNVAKS